MVIPLGHLQVRAQHGHIQRGGGLADAAAELVNDLAVDICVRRLISARLGAFSDHTVIRKFIAWVEYGPVDGRRRQIDVVGARGIALVQVGHRLRQRIPKQLFLQVRRRHLGRRGRDRDGIALLRPIPHDLPRLVDIELHAGLFRHNGFAVLFIDRRAHRLADHLLGDLIHIDRRRLGQLGRNLIRLEIHQADLFRQRLLDRVRVELHARLAGMDGHGIRANVPSGFYRLGQRLRGDVGQCLFQPLLIHGGRQLRLAPAENRCDHIPHAGQRVARASDRIGVLRGLRRVHIFQHVAHRNTVGLLINCDGNVRVLIQWRALLFDLRRGGAPAQPADRDRPDRHPWEHIRIKVGEPAEQDQQSRCHAADYLQGERHAERFLFRLRRGVLRRTLHHMRPFPCFIDPVF